ncbi:DUF2399 domain-containing protein [Numidum massiliense]|uniref:DUF2399 domain-containing protein n=1 Tax=Numidum massiliense TaxID=1522315 RepID=UPI0009E7B322|nr:DUF2399 domain-containing protein [Numidum massiliense]
MDDDISSNVTTFGLTVGASGADAVDATIPFPARDYPFVLTLRHLRQAWQWVCARPLYVVENPSVFSAIIDAWEGEGICSRPQLALTRGQPHVAALQLLDQ